MARPVFAPTDIKLIKKCILMVLRMPDKDLTDDEMRELEIMYHRLGRLGD